jgi:large subunit ribosomal protein L29
LEVDLGKLKFDHAVTGLADPTVIKNTRREIARVKTEMRRREIAEMSEEQINMRSKIRARRARK